MTSFYGFQRVSVKEKQEKIHALFHRVAPVYDRMNDVMSLGLHRHWKTTFLQRLPCSPVSPFPLSILELGCGTGDLSLRLLQKLSPRSPHQLVFSDPNPSMLEIAERRLRQSATITLPYTLLQLAAENLPQSLPPASQDLIFTAFTLRNVASRLQALRAIRRVLRPGGILFCLEFTPAPALLAPFYTFYITQVIPPLGHLLGQGEWDSYRYLAESIYTFPSALAWQEEWKKAGFVGVGYERWSTGIVAMHWGMNPFLGP